MCKTPDRISNLRLKSGIQSVVLLGMMGAGKTTVGRLLAQKLGIPFVDLDQEIEKQCSLAVPEIFRNLGEMAFRDLERSVLQELLSRKVSWVLALGGGTWVFESNRNLIEQNPDLVTIYLQAQESTLLKRVLADPNQRPLLTRTATLENRMENQHLSQMAENIRILLKMRANLYEKARIRVDTDFRSPEQLADYLFQKIVV